MQGAAAPMAETSDWRTTLTTAWRATPSGPFFELAEPADSFLQSLPEEYLTGVAEFGGREGFLGETYIRLYRLEELVSLNLAYEVPTLLPEVIVFGSNGCGEAFAFRRRDSAVVQVPFLPMNGEYVEFKAINFVAFIRSLAASGDSSECDPEAVGMEVHEKLPICFGGSPTDPANKVLAPAAKHAEICGFWNSDYREAVARQLSGG